MKSILATVLLISALCVGQLYSTDLSITAASVIAGPRAVKQQGVAGVAITAGQALYYDSTAASYKLADADASATTALIVGIAAHGAGIGQPITVIIEDDDLTVGATLSMVAPVYVLSATAGGIAPSADITTGWRPCPLIVAKSTTKAIFKANALRGTAVAVAP